MGLPGKLGDNTGGQKSRNSPDSTDPTISKPCHMFIIKPTRCTDFSNLFWNETLYISDSSSVHHQEFFHCTHSNGICHTSLMTACKQDQDGKSCQQTCLTYTIVVCTVKKTPDDGQRNCPKHVEFHSKINLRNSASSWFNYKDLSRCTVTMHGHMNVKNLPYAFCRRNVLDVLRHANENQTFTILDQYVERFNYFNP